MTLSTIRTDICQCISPASSRYFQWVVRVQSLNSAPFTASLLSPAGISILFTKTSAPNRIILDNNNAGVQIYTAGVAMAGSPQSGDQFIGFGCSAFGTNANLLFADTFDQDQIFITFTGTMSGSAPPDVLPPTRLHVLRPSDHYKFEVIKVPAW